MANNNQGLFVGLSNVWDVTEIYSVDVKSPEFKELLVRLYQNINNISMVLNLKDSGYYNLQEFVNGQLYFPDPNLNSTTSTQPTFRQVYRMVINFGQLPNTAAATAPHNLTPRTSWTFTRIYGAASDTTGLTYIPIPYSSSVDADCIELSVDATDVTITTGSDRTNYDQCYVVLEYIKN